MNDGRSARRGLKIAGSRHRINVYLDAKDDAYATAAAARTGQSVSHWFEGLLRRERERSTPAALLPPPIERCERCNLMTTYLTNGICPPCRSIASGHGL